MKQYPEAQDTSTPAKLPELQQRQVHNTLLPLLAHGNFPSESMGISTAQCFLADTQKHCTQSLRAAQATLKANRELKKRKAAYQAIALLAPP